MVVVAAVCVTAPAAQAAEASPAAGSSGVAWNLHEGLYGSSDGLPEPLKGTLLTVADSITNVLAPGLLARKAQEAEQARLAEEARQQPQHPGFDPSKCPPSARACLDLDNEITWLQKDGVVTYGPVKESAGAPYPATATPRGSFRVLRKVKDEISYVYDNAPMPYAVYFTNNGIAFHEGSIDLWSHGCVHLTHQDAKHYFDNLNIGDEVYVF